MNTTNLKTFACNKCGKKRNQPSSGYMVREVCFTCEVKESFAQNLLGDFTEREQKIMKARLGLEDGQTRTLEEVGKLFGVTRERVRQIESKVVAKLDIMKNDLIKAGNNK